MSTGTGTEPRGRTRPGEAPPKTGIVRTPGSTVLQIAPSRRWLYVLLGAPALFPVACMLPGVIARDTKTLGTSVADVLGTGAEVLLFTALSISPIVLVTGQRWLMPLRKWYGIMAGITALVDAVIAGATTVEFGPPVQRLVGHIFLFTGLVMAIILTVLLATANNYSQRVLGKYWKKIHKLVYVVWALLGAHLALLFNFGPYSGGTIIHQRVYQYFFISAVLVFYRLPMIRKGINKARRAGLGWLIMIMSIPLLGIFLFWFVFLINEEVFKGVAALTGRPINN